MVEMRKQNLNGVSNLSGEGLKALYEEIRDLYLSDDRPWIIGYSGGKDSTTALQAIWYAISELPREKREKMIFVISSDTLVETPVIVDYIDNTLNRINEAAKIHGMPFQAEKVMPLMEDSFWTNLIGRGYPAPTTTFRWCTERMKIDPANRFILERVAEYGEVIMVLGVRSDESATRAQVMSCTKLLAIASSGIQHYLALTCTRQSKTSRPMMSGPICSSGNLPGAITTETSLHSTKTPKPVNVPSL